MNNKQMLRNLGLGLALSAMLDDDQVAAVAKYVRSHFGNQYTDQVTPAEVEALRPKKPAASE